MSGEIMLLIDELEERIMELMRQRDAFMASEGKTTHPDICKRVMRDYEFEIACFRAELEAWTCDCSHHHYGLQDDQGVVAYA